MGLLRGAAGVLARVLGVVALVWLLLELAPGTAADRLLSPESAGFAAGEAARLGLDDPAWVRFGRLLGRLARLDLGVSHVDGQPVLALLASHLGPSVVLGAASLAWALPVGAGLGFVQGLRRHAPLDRAGDGATLLALAVPPFVVLVLLQVAAPWLGLPLAGLADPLRPTGQAWWADPGDVGRHLLIPAFAAGLAPMAKIARLTRAATAEALDAPWVLAAQVRGLPDGLVFRRHVLPHALLPVLPLVSLLLPRLAGGVVLVEVLYAWPGLGWMLERRLRDQDVPVVVGCLVLFAVAVVLSDALARLTRAAVDPRARR